ncbi:MAG TPA: hypothetical protein VHH12_16355, partial [Mycobacterium sp.]|nr:hypothetical protein [Mycobacterium sp.]
MPLTKTTSRRLGATLAAASAAIAFVFAVFAMPAAAQLEITEFDGEVYNLDANGDPVAATQAGSHPDYARMSFRFATEPSPGFSPLFPLTAPTESLKDLKTELPVGLVGNPQAMPKCSDRQLASSLCPNDTQVGFTILEFGNFPGSPYFGLVPVFNMEANRPGTPARFGFNFFVTGPIYLDASVRSDRDYGIDIDVSNASQGAGLVGAETVLWGVPADPMHDADRGTTNGLPVNFGGTNCAEVADPAACSNRAGLPEVPLITLPTSCTGPVETRLSVNSWQFPNGWNDHASFLSHHPGDPDALVGSEGCENVPFEPSFAVEPHSTEPGASSGYTVDLRIPQPMNPDGIESAHLRRAVVTMPEGVRMNPSAGDGLAGCSDAQVGLNNEAPATCPQASKIGTVTVHTPVLENALQGGVFLGTQVPGDPYRIFFVIEGSGVIVKLKGSVTPDPVTGQLTATFENNPQLPFDHMRVVFKDGPRAPLANPTECGTHTLTSTLTPWSGTAPVHPSDSFTIDCPGDSGGFEPGFAAGVTNSVAGIFSPFALRVTRNGGKDLGRINVAMPKGALAALKHVDVCSEAQLASAASKTGRQTQASSACPAGSQVGTVTVGAGAGPTPFYPALPGSKASGRVFLTVPHTNTGFHMPGSRQAAYGLAVEVPAVAGPFDLGTVVVRAAIYVDPDTAEISVLSDTMPRILEGVPLNVRDVRVDIDREDFTTTPSSCDEQRVGGDIRAQDNTPALRHSRFDVGNCEKLRFKPRLAMRLTGKRQRTTGKHPGVRAVVRQTGMGEAGIDRAKVTLPSSLALDPDNAQALCEFDDGTKDDLENHCPEGSIVGRARAVSPLLKQPLLGDVYFVKNVR